MSDIHDPCIILKIFSEGFKKSLFCHPIRTTGWGVIPHSEQTPTTENILPARNMFMIKTDFQYWIDLHYLFFQYLRVCFIYKSPSIV